MQHLIKAVTFETLSNTLCLGIAYSYFGHFGACLIFTGICFVLKLILYYYHEKVWEHYRPSKQDEPLNLEYWEI